MGFCTKCGAELKEGAVFCALCGMKVENGVQQQSTEYIQNIPPVIPNVNTNYYQENSKKSTNKIIKIVLIAVVALIALLLVIKVISSLATPGYEKPVKAMMDGMEDGNFNKLMKAFPDYITDSMDDMLDYYEDEDEFMDEILGSLENQFGENIKISYKITDKDKMDKDEIEDVEDNIASQYDENVNVKAGYTLEIVMKIKGSEDKDTQETELDVIKIGSKWYLSDFSF